MRLPRRPSPKGQSLTVEQMFLFTIGLLITIAIFLSFRAISSHVTNLAEEDQLNEIGTLTLSGIQRVGKELASTDRAAMRVEIPKTISRQEYIIFADGVNVIVLMPGGKNATLDMEGLEDAYLVTGRVSSSTGAMTIEGAQSDRTIRLVRRI